MVVIISVLQVCMDCREMMDKVDIDAIMAKFVETKGTGRERPGKISQNTHCF